MREPHEALDAVIVAGSDRHAATLVEDVRRTADELGAAAASMPQDAWGRLVRYTNGTEHPAAVIVPSRLADLLIRL